MEEWNAIDLHIHTCEGITRDKSKDEVNFKYVYLQDVVSKFNIKLMAVTNHNKINFENYILMKYLLKLKKCNILMGVELDTNLAIGTPIHIAAIFEENFQDNFEVTKEINQRTLAKMQETEICYTNEEIVNILKKYDVIMIPHGNKDKGVFKNATREQIEESLKKIREGFIRIFDSPSDWKLIKIKNFLSELNDENLDNFGGVLFSDVRNWEKYEEKYRNFFMNAQPTFKGILHSISNPIRRFKPYSEIVTNHNYISKIKFTDNNDGRIEECEINLSSGYNCIIGKSGSGKSLLLHMIKKKLLKNLEQDENYNFSENTNIELINEEGHILDNTMINLGIGENIYNKIIHASSTKDNDDLYSIITLLNDNFTKEEKFNEFKKVYNDKLKKYIELIITIEEESQNLIVDKNKLLSDIKRLNELKEIKIFDVKTIEYNNDDTYTEENIENFKEYTQDIDSLVAKVRIYKGEYKNKVLEEIEILKRKFKLIELDMIKTQKKKELEQMKYLIINKSIENINLSKSQKVEEKSKLLNLIPKEIKDITKNVLNIHLNKLKKDSLDLSIQVDRINSETVINKNVIVIESLANEIFTKVNEKENDVFDTNRYKMQLDKNTFYDLTSKEEAKKMIDKYISCGVLRKGKDTISNNLNLNVQIKFDGQDVKEMNPGSIAKKYIEIYFEKYIQNGKNNVVIFDQIENDVDKEFINGVIRNLIEETKGHVQLIIVTHDPIVAVNADPNKYIESKKNEKNKFEYRSFVAESYERDELSTIACNVDGSKEVIKGRYEIYEGESLYGN